MLVSFEAAAVDPRHHQWLATVESRIGLGQLDPQPYWGFDDLYYKAGTKLLNSFFVQVEAKREAGHEFFRYVRIMMLQGFSLEALLRGIEEGYVYVDFDARSGHNHGTKLRLSQDKYPTWYSHVTLID